jgi:uncharacterized damage-inducible protein DinB
MTPYGAAELAASFRTVRKNTIQVAMDIPEEQYSFLPAPGMQTVSQMLAHIAVAPRIWTAINHPDLTTLDGFDFVGLFQANRAEEEKARTKEELIAFLTAEGEAFATFLSGLSDEFLSATVAQPGGQPAKMRLESLMGAKEHEMHHRGQLMLVERLLGITPHATRVMQERMAAMQANKQ